MWINVKWGQHQQNDMISFQYYYLPHYWIGGNHLTITKTYQKQSVSLVASTAIKYLHAVTVAWWKQIIPAHIVSRGMIQLMICRLFISKISLHSFIFGSFELLNAIYYGWSSTIFPLNFGTDGVFLFSAVFSIHRGDFIYHNFRANLVVNMNFFRFFMFQHKS